VIDLTGLTASPGFIDVHSHSDFTLPINPTADSKIHQGVTTEVLGNCGESAFPLIGDALEEAKEYTETLGYVPDWVNLSEYVARLRSKLTVNVASLIGLGTLRSAIVGLDRKDLREKEMTQMASVLQKTVSDGACGISSGLIYPPSCWAGEEELVFLARAMAGRGVYASHIRSEGSRLIDAIIEAISVGRRAGISVQISHHKAAGKNNWGKTEQSLRILTEAQASGVDVHCDVYPYAASSFSLRSMFPLWSRDGKPGKFIENLKDPQLRARIKRAMEEDPDETSLQVADWDKTMVTSVASERNRSLQGKSIQEIGLERGTTSFDAACDLLVEERGTVGVVRFSMDEADIARVVQDDLTMIGSDAAAYAPEGVLGKGQPHPRSYGTFPRVLAEYVRKQRVLTLEEAIHKMSGLAARKFSLRDRGFLKDGYYADIVVFETNAIEDRATYDAPHQYPTGIHLVLVNGRVVLEDGELTSHRPGRFLREFRKIKAISD
jgi:N-acyl-D-amino-acid deacylase